MLYKQTTQVPNYIFDQHLSKLTEAELKILLVVIRQTHGWIDKRTGSRKKRDRITSYQFRNKAGLSRRTVTNAIQSLAYKRLICITDFEGKELREAADRKGKSTVFYSVSHPAHLTERTYATKVAEPVQNGGYNKTNRTKIIPTKLNGGSGCRHIGEFLGQRNLFSDQSEN